jgi:hypothetical protein
MRVFRQLRCCGSQLSIRVVALTADLVVKDAEKVVGSYNVGNL